MRKVLWLQSRLSLWRRFGIQILSFRYFIWNSFFFFLGKNYNNKNKENYYYIGRTIDYFHCI